MVRRIALAGAVLMLGLTACGAPSHGWSGPMTDVKCTYAGKQVNLFMVMHFAPGAATNSPHVTPYDLAVEPPRDPAHGDLATNAAMVLAKRHVQRLWFPLPGAGGSIPSRAASLATLSYSRKIVGSLSCFR